MPIHYAPANVTELFMVIKFALRISNFICAAWIALQRAKCYQIMTIRHKTRE